MMANYVLLKKGLSGLPQLVEPNKVTDIIESDLDKDWYQSVFYYNDEHVRMLKEKGTLTGVTDIKTDKLVFDFDDGDNPDNAKKDALELTTRLQAQNISKDNIEVYFSGNKGFHVIVTLTKQLSPRQVGIAAKKLANGLKTFDSQIYNASRILRVSWTKNQKSGLHKVPLTVNQLRLPIDKIKDLASDINKVITNFNWKPVEVSDVLFQEKEEPKKIQTVTSTELDLTNKPRHWPDYKWALLNSIKVGPNERHEALMRLAATCRGLGYPEEMARALCLTFDDKFIASTNKPAVEDLDSNILNTIYSDKWNGGAYSIKTDTWLQEYAKRVGINAQDNEELTIEINEAFDMFKDYAINIDKLTVKSGIPQLDKNLRMTIGMSVGVLAAAGVGKTTLALQILNSMSNSNEQSVFFSYDMYHALVFQKLVQKHLKVSDKEIFEKFKNNDIKFQQDVMNVLKKEYNNVEFCFKTGQTPDDIERTIKYTEEKTGKKVRLAVIDYNELVLSDYADSTQSSSFVAQKLREIATKLNVCVIVLLQPNKMSGTPADELKSYRSAKGSSAIEQSLSVMLGMSRPGYNPRRPEDDQFITINCLKNRMGSLFTLDLGWEGASGDIYELSDEQEAHLNEIRERKKQEESNDGSSEWK